MIVTVEDVLDLLEEHDLITDTPKVEDLLHRYHIRQDAVVETDGQAIVKDGDPDANDFRLNPECGSVWLGVKNLALWIHVYPETVSVEIYDESNPDEEGDELASCVADFPEENK